MQIRRTQKRKRNRITKYYIVVLFLALILGFLLVALERKIRPVMLFEAEIKSKELCVNIMQKAVEEKLREEPEMYSDLVIIKRDADDKISDVACDPLKLIVLQNKMESAVSRALANRKNLKLEIPVGTLSGIQLLSGKGFLLQCAILPISAVQSRVETQMENAGINQTVLRVDVVLSIQIRTVMSGLFVTDTVESSVCVAQIAIVGDTPEFYAKG